jgi:type IV pilus assembly protein PilW
MTPKSIRHQQGFSLVELMISVVIAMLALAFALRMVADSERSREAELGGSDSMQNGMVALFSISGDAGQAGFGLNDTIVAGCNTTFLDNGGYTLAPAMRGTTPVTPLAPVVIEANGSAPDRVTFYAGSSQAGTATLRLTTSYSSGTRIDVDAGALWLQPGRRDRGGAGKAGRRLRTRADLEQARGPAATSWSAIPDHRQGQRLSLQQE